MIPLGSIVKDKITGFKGVVMGVTTWLYGCVRLAVEPQELKDGKPIPAQSFDEQRLDMVEPLGGWVLAMPVSPSRTALGSVVRDVVTGYTGVVVGTSVWLGGPARVGVEARELNKDGKPMEGQWFEEGRVEVLEEPSAKYLPPASTPEVPTAVPPLIAQEPAKTGGPQPDPAPASRGVFSAGGE